jgi:hypothetical protein
MLGSGRMDDFDVGLCYTLRMAKISMVVADEDLAMIDAVAEPNRTAFMVAAAKQAAALRHRERLDATVARCLAETALDDFALDEEFAGVAGDGL